MENCIKILCFVKLYDAVDLQQRTELRAWYSLSKLNNISLHYSIKNSEYKMKPLKLDFANILY